MDPLDRANLRWGLLPVFRDPLSVFENRHAGASYRVLKVLNGLSHWRREMQTEENPPLLAMAAANI
jgi:hypothetical protein